MDGERISLRLELEDLKLIDDFIAEKPEYSSRSQLARVAIRSFIEGTEPTVENKKRESKGNTITVEIPRAAMKALLHAVRAGLYTSVESAIEECVRDKFIHKEHLEDIKRKVLDSHRETLEALSDEPTDE